MDFFYLLIIIGLAGIVVGIFITLSILTYLAAGTLNICKYNPITESSDLLLESFKPIEELADRKFVVFYVEQIQTISQN